ncbi:MAG: nicotinate-nucleotide--dimethylbenzimidazole phosphoribosyltransferase [Tissierellia bacterium]|nr:nicotinate-nucleotide--dimethylbenzimidazole phosphoribosyltransferase [Tissierellia bacterium]
MEKINKTIENIEPLNGEAMEKAKSLWDSRTHPIGSLGELEEITIRLSGIQGKVAKSLNKRGIVVMCADNGIYEENISSSPQIFTYLLTNAMASGQTGVSSLAKSVNADVFVVDIGVIPGGEFEPNVLRRNIRKGSGNFLKEKALSREEVIQGIKVGIDLGDKLFQEGYDILGTGELGIANTSTSSAVLTALTGLSPSITVGLGGGITDKQLERKKEVIQEAMNFHHPDPKDPIDVLSKVGGLDICGLVGVFLSGAKNRIPVVIDGLISSVAALCAYKLTSKVQPYLFPSHLSKEAAAGKVLELLGLKPLVTMEMRLGEGSACPFTFAILDMGLYALHHMGTFDSTQIENKILVNIRDKE